jgi:hypothetical protein
MRRGEERRVDGMEWGDISDAAVGLWNELSWLDGRKIKKEWGDGKIY